MDKLYPPQHQLIIKDKKRERTVVLESSAYSIGRDYNNTIVIHSETISRYHATLLRITIAGTDRYHFRIIDGDLSGRRSRNGIKVNGKKCFSHDLQDGDIISFDADIIAIYKAINVSSIRKVPQATFVEEDCNATCFIGDSNILHSDNSTGSKHTLQMTSEERQASIQRSLERLASFPELFSEPIIEINFQGNITYLNPAAVERFPAIKTNQLLHPILNGIVDLLQNSSESCVIREISFQNEVFEESIHLIPAIQVIRIYISNITKRKKAEIILKQTQQLLENRVEQRTLELNDINKKLQQKIDKIQRVEQKVRLLQTITQAIAEAEDFEEALEITMTRICKTVGWSYAETWIPDRQENILKLSPSWFDRFESSEELKNFRRESLTLNFPYNVGKPGRVWATKRPEWTKDVSQQDGTIFLRKQIAQKAKLKTSLGVPMIAKGMVIAVFLFFDTSAHTENVQTIQLVTSVIAQLGLIVERKRAEDALRSSMATNKAILNAIPDLILRVNREGIFVNYKAANAKSLLSPDRSFLGKHINEIFPEEISLPFMNSIEKTFATGEVQLLECQISDRDKVSSYEVRIAISDIDEVMAIVRDITERKQAEADIHRTLEQEKKLNELKGRFVTMASHEFRTPLTTILSSAELLEHYSHKWSPEKQQKYLYQIQSSVKHMTDLLNDVLLLGKADADKIQLNPVPIDLFQFCQDLVEEIAMSNQTHQIIFSSKCSIEADDSHPQQSNDVCLDEKILRHIINNLLSNAIKYSPHSDKVIFDTICEPKQAVLRVRDFGIGIPPSERDRLFDSFHRCENVGSIPGTGLGLPIVKRSVDLHGGTITVDSEIDVGTTFTVTLPYSNKC